MKPEYNYQSNVKHNTQTVHHRWSDYNTSVMEYKYDYYEDAWVWLQVQSLKKQMYLSTITLECNHDYFHESLMNVLILFLP